MKEAYRKLRSMEEGDMKNPTIKQGRVGIRTWSAIFATIALASLCLTECSPVTSSTPTNLTYTVTYDGNGATGGSVPTDTTNYLQGATVTVLGNTGNLVKTGNSFLGWNTGTDGSGTSYTQGQTFAMGSANVTLYANWTTAPTYTVTYDGNGAAGGSVPTDTTNYLQGATVTVLGNTGNLVKTGNSFLGWNTAADGSGTSYTQGQTFAMGSANVMLYANWTTAPTYTVTYNDNGATGGSIPTDTTNYLQGTTVTVLGNTGNLVKTGNSFVGWNTAADGSGTSYNGSQSLTMGSASVTLYALWSSGVSAAGTINIIDGRQGDYTFTIGVKNIALQFITPDTSGQYPVYSISSTDLPVTIEVATTPIADSWRWFLDDVQRSSSSPPWILSSTNLPIQIHYGTIKAKKGSDLYRSATIILARNN
jgi:hypothetical protein